ncbi:MAG: P pilus assembly/Cpx signaling pathway, periplasmic inhibitor/zinc-resistance associated protein [Cyanobacteria bacterium P01_A01_bin.68]
MLNLKRTSLILAAIVTVGTAGAAFANIQSSSNDSVVVAQSQKREGKREGKFKRLNLTEDQKAQMQQIRESARAQMQEVLTPEQLEKLEAAKASGQKKREVFRSLNLTDTQKAEMKEIKESKKAQFEAILTDEQKAQLQEMKQNRQNRRRSSR